MSSTEEKTELKGGHLPAVKAGGMRITRHQRTSESEKEKPTPEDKELYEEEGMTKGEKHNQSVLVSGAVVKEDQAYTPAAVKHYHDKPIPSKDHRAPPKLHNIQQPGKQ